MAGTGSRFKSAGYTTLKPLLPIGRIKMIELVIENLDSPAVSKIVLVALSDVIQSASLSDLSARYQNRIEIVSIDSLTDGPATTCMLARANLNEDDPLVIANSDQFLDVSMSQEYEEWNEDGFVWCMNDDDPKWSYARLDENNNLVEIIEKVVISNLATCGVYGFAKAKYFFDAYIEMSARNDRTNGELYVAPTYNYLSSRGLKIRAKSLGKTATVMHGLGVPDDYETFLKTDIPAKLGLLNSD
jgi:NDP-sugar pyrophosphorylase family protein